MSIGNAWLTFALELVFVASITRGSTRLGGMQLIIRIHQHGKSCRIIWKEDVLELIVGINESDNHKTGRVEKVQQNANDQVKFKLWTRWVRYKTVYLALEVGRGFFHCLPIETQTTKGR